MMTEQHISPPSPNDLQERLKQAAVRDRDLDLEIANDWSAVDQEQCQRLEDQERPRPTRDAG
jgi:hypothetical protein